jgi:pyridoxal phosphate enzyme (YggS family)
MPFPGLAIRVAQVREQIAIHQANQGWSHPVAIIAVTKTHGPEAVRAAWEAGIRAVGENRIQEALPKQDAVTELPIEWHLIGGLQRNKARLAIGRFALIHSVDREDLAAELNRRAEPGIRQPVLVQVNCSEEPQKGGVEPAALQPLLEVVRSLPHLELRGLMTMAEFTEDASVQRAAFRRLRSLKESAERQGHVLPELSMGMSGDYRVAVEEGATMVRLGTLLFGERVL